MVLGSVNSREVSVDLAMSDCFSTRLPVFDNWKYLEAIEEVEECEEVEKPEECEVSEEYEESKELEESEEVEEYEEFWDLVYISQSKHIIIAWHHWITNHRIFAASQ